MSSAVFTIYMYDISWNYLKIRSLVAKLFRIGSGEVILA